jgi:hypothetical protein
MCGGQAIRQEVSSTAVWGFEHGPLAKGFFDSAQCGCYDEKVSGNPA